MPASALLLSLIAGVAVSGCAQSPVNLDPSSVNGRDGGGRADMAQAGGPDATRAETALAAVERAIAAKGQDQAAE